MVLSNACDMKVAIGPSLRFSGCLLLAEEGLARTHSPRLNRNVRYWHLADIQQAEPERPLSEAKQTWNDFETKSADDPLQTFAIVCEVRRTGFRSGFPDACLRYPELELLQDAALACLHRWPKQGPDWAALVPARPLAAALVIETALTAFAR